MWSGYLDADAVASFEHAEPNPFPAPGMTSWDRMRLGRLNMPANMWPEAYDQEARGRPPTGRTTVIPTTAGEAGTPDHDLA